MIQLNAVGQEVLAWLSSVPTYVPTLPIAALIGLVLPCVAALLTRSAGAFLIAVLLAFAALTIPSAGPGERHQYSTLVLLVLSGLLAAGLAATSRYRDRSELESVLSELEDARREISDLEAPLQQGAAWRTAMTRQAG